MRKLQNVKNKRVWTDFKNSVTVLLFTTCKN